MRNIEQHASDNVNKVGDLVPVAITIAFRPLPIQASLSHVHTVSYCDNCQDLPQQASGICAGPGGEQV